jgi:hypothetical protein
MVEIRNNYIMFMRKLPVIYHLEDQDGDGRVLLK